jgi:hypothetical protein
MKILILDDDGTVLYEQNNPGYIHLPIISDGKYDCECDDDECRDPRCVERRQEAERLLEKWQKGGQELAFRYFFQSGEDVDEFKQFPNHEIPKKVTIRFFHRNELAFTTGERVEFLLPHVNVYGDNQVMFMAGKWQGSLYPWDECRHGKSHPTDER